jgi:hypothetical protein
VVVESRPGAHRADRPDAAARLGAPQGRARCRDDRKAVPGVGAEIVLTVDGEWRKTRLFRSHEQAELVGAERGELIAAHQTVTFRRGAAGADATTARRPNVSLERLGT